MNKTVTCENRVIPIRGEVPLREASLFGCAIPTGAGAVMNMAKVQPGEDLAVFGVGGIGMSAILAAVMAGAERVIAVDIDAEKLRRAAELGATHLIDASAQDPAAAIADITGGRGVAYAIEAAGRQETMENALKVVRERGGLCILAGNLPHGGRISIDPFEFIKGKRLVGTWGGETVPDRDIPRYAELYLSGKLQVERLITHTYDLGDINQAFADLEDGRIGRGLIKLGAVQGDGRT